MQELALRLGVALAIGLVVGVERGWRERNRPAGSRTAGIRTYTLSGLVGGVSAALAQAVASPSVLVATFLIYAVIFAVFVWREMQREKVYSVTGLVAALLVFVLGALAVAGEPEVAGAGGIATAGVLASREASHALLRRLTFGEISSALVLLAMTVIVLPQLPDHAVDPFNSVNPRQIWLFTVLTAAVSYAGYVAVKVAGAERGILLGALAGALVSSTAVTIAFARRAAQGEAPGLLAGGASLAAMVSVLRVLTFCAVVAPSMLATLGPAAGAAALAFAGSGAWLMRRAAGGPQAPTALSNPFELKPLLAFAAGFAALSFVSGLLLAKVGAGSLFLISAITGIVDVDMATLNAARLAGNALTAPEAAHVALVALAVNAVSRVGFAFSVGTAGYGTRLGAATLVAAAAGAAGLLVAH